MSKALRLVVIALILANLVTGVVEARHRKKKATPTPTPTTSTSIE